MRPRFQRTFTLGLKIGGSKGESFDEIVQRLTERSKSIMCRMLRHRNQEVILLEASHRLELSEAQKELAWRSRAMQKKRRNLQ